MLIDIQKVIEDNKCSVVDIGFLEVQVVLLIVCIELLIGYFKIYKKDYYSCRGLLQMVNCCCSLFDYLKKKDVECYKVLIEKFGLCC